MTLTSELEIKLKIHGDYKLWAAGCIYTVLLLLFLLLFIIFSIIAFSMIKQGR